MLRILVPIVLLALGACAAEPPSPLLTPDTGTDPTSPANVLARSRSGLLEDARTLLGDAALAEAMAARTMLVVRGPTSFGRKPGVAAAIRTTSGWVRIGEAGTRSAFDAAASRELDRLTGSAAFWSEPSITSATCTDPSGIIFLARRAGREFVSPYPCGFAGLTGQAANIVLAGRISDWGLVPPEIQPAGVPLARFDEATQSLFRSMSGIPEQRLIAIRNATEWDAQWRRMMMPMGKLPPLPRVDFDREMLIIAAMGPQRSGGYSVAIQRVIDQQDELLAIVRFVSPGPSCGTIAAITSPVDIVRIPRSEKNVRFLLNRGATDCP